MVKMVMIGVLLFLSLPLYACYSSADCNGGTCARSPGESTGVCVGTHSISNQNADVPASSTSTNPSRSTGKLCSFSLDCGPGYQCLKNSSQIEGICVSK